MRIYVDSVILIYLLEGSQPFRMRAVSRLANAHASGDSLAVSDLVRLECRMHPIRLGNKRALDDYDALFAQVDVERIAISTAMYDRATTLRARLNLRLGDALHLATAIEAACDVFLTNDVRLSRCTDIHVEVLP